MAAHESKQRSALFFIALLLLDGLPGAVATRARVLSARSKARAQEAHSDESAVGEEAATVIEQESEDLNQRWWWGSEDDGGVPEDEAEAAVFQYEQLKDPHKPIVSKYRDGKGWLDSFSRLTGLRGNKADEFYAETVRKVLPEEYIAEASQFALCARVSSSASQEEDATISLRCTPTMNLLPAVTDQDTSGRFNFKDVWKALRDLVDEIKVPNINWSEDWVGNSWRKLSNWATGKKNRFLREQAKMDEWFKDYFAAQVKATSMSFLKESIPVEVDKVQQLQTFDAAVGSTTIQMTSALDESHTWPGENQPSMGSRYVLCFGRLSKPGKREIDPDQMGQHCTGFWNKHMTKDAIVGLGESLKADDTWLYRNETLFQTRMEILYGRSTYDAQASAFHLVGRSPSSRTLAQTIAKLVRERVSAEGLECEPCQAAALGINVPKEAMSQSLVQTDATAGRTGVCPWLNTAPYSNGVWSLTLKDGCLTSATMVPAGGTVSVSGGIVIGGVAFPPALIVTGIIVVMYILKNVMKTAWKAYLTSKKLKKWQRLLSDKDTGARHGCFVTGSQAKRTRGNRCPKN